MTKKKPTKARGRQIRRDELCGTVVSALLEASTDGEISSDTAGRLVARIIRQWPVFSERQQLNWRQAWLRALKEQTAVRKLAEERQARSAARRQRAVSKLSKA